jgi:Fe-S cluster assembly protein SufD
LKAIAPNKLLGNYLEAFGELQERTSRQPAWLRSLREGAFAQFAETGFPTTKNEDWRFTNVSAISQTPFRAAPDAGESVSSAVLRPLLSADTVCRLVFVNGRFAPLLSRLGELPVGVEVGSLAERIGNRPEALESDLGSQLDIGRDAFTALNTAFIEDGAYIYLPPGTVLETPIWLLFVSLPGAEPAMVHPRNLIVAAQQTQASIVEDYISLGSGVCFSNCVTELMAGDDAVISHYRIERESVQALNVSTLFTRQARGSNLASHSVLLGGALVRNNVNPVLAGEGAECLINGLFLARGSQHMDNYMLVEHRSPHCRSRQFYNGILDDRAHGVFHGRIVVQKNAQKTDAKQTNRNLLLSDNAQIDTKPQLEIHADDVKCTHGATIGQVEEEALFYLRSRGIDEASARRLLLFAFASECLDRMGGPARTFLQDQIQQWLPEGRRSPALFGSEIERRWEEVG